MLKSPGLIIPLFYHVHPTHVRYPLSESSPYNQSFHKHYGHSDRYTREEVDRWKNALVEICKRSGWSMDLTEGYEARLVKMVVNDLIKTLDRVPLQVAEHPVGIDSMKNLLIQKLNLNSMNEVFKLGIWGIGGIGKTTVAKAVYNQVYAGFPAASFVSNVHATATEATGLTKLQKQILEELVQYDGKVQSVAKGIFLLRDRLGGKRVLLILDDVDAVIQLKALVGDWLAPGSRVIITSRDEHILNVARADCIHEMGGLEMDEALQLFSWHAFLSASPSQNYQDVSKRIVEACKGHPLSLEVIGSLLYDKQDNRSCWEEALQNITSNRYIYNRLYISYSALSNTEQEIFIDIACFFIGEHKSLPIVFWKSLYEKVDTAVCNLSMKLLVKVNDDGVFDMHDHLRDMGRTIAEKEKVGSRIWEADHSSIRSNNITHFQLNGGDPKRLESLYKHTLRYLCLQNMDIEGMTKDTLAMLPPGLIWLRLENCWFYTGMNRIKRKHRHSRSVGNLWQLRTLQITSCDVVGSHHISSLFSLPNIQLQHLYLEDCYDLNNLPDTIGNLSHLQNFNLSSCENLTNLPDTMGNLLQLQKLDLSGCVNLKNLPDTIGNMSQLQNLNLSYCVNLDNLPDTIGNLSQLQNLELIVCEDLNKLPDTIGKLSQLQNLNLSGCVNLNNLPDTISNLLQLHNLDLSGCENLNKLPETIENLSQLQNLNLSYCVKLDNLPNTIGNLPQLQNLDLRGCVHLNNLLQQNLDLSVCEDLNNLNDTIGNLSQL